MGDLFQLITAFLGSLGFAVLFHVRKNLLCFAALGGLINWSVYLILMHAGLTAFQSCLAASVAAAVYAEVLARLKKAPATIFLVPAVVPSIPGSTLYYTMSYVVRGNRSLAESYGIMTLQYALAIAIGISSVWALSAMLNKGKHPDQGRHSSQNTCSDDNFLL